MSLTIEIDMPADLKRFRLPKAVDRRCKICSTSNPARASCLAPNGKKRMGSLTSRKC
jgi:hypothetical protein